MTALDDRPAANRKPYEPKDRYVAGARPVLLTGVQAIARLLVEQNVRDAGRTATLVSGYPGSPLGGLDKLLHTLPQLKTDHGVHLVPGLNEELGATAVWGSQQVPGNQGPDGVIGMWYGKGPGVDRSGDTLRHGNTYGANPKGGVLVMAGDDPGAKSSTVPCTSEKTLASFGMPVLSPRNGEEVIAFGMYGVALSRLSGCWVGVKILADVADGLWTVDRDFQAIDITIPQVEWNGRPWTYSQLLMKDPRDSTIAEAALLGPRWAAVEAFQATNPLDEITSPAPGAWLGIAATGTAYDATLQALRDLGISDPADAGIRVLRVGMPYPLGAGLVREFATGLETLLVVEEKTSFLEAQLKDVLYGVTNAPAIVGKKGLDGRLLVPADGQVSADRLENPLRTVLGDRIQVAPRKPGPRTQLTLSPVKRTPYFCSGCPHNRSTPLPEGSLGGGGIGCHTMVTLSDRPDQAVLALTQMGGEGSQWVGQSPFTDVPHIFQNVGDGTFAHSAQLSVQFCVAAGVNITYKLLYNQVVAMTGAQNAEGGLPVDRLTHKLHAEGVSQIVVVSDEPKKHKRSKFAPGVTVRHRDEMDAVQKELREVKGVTVLIYDQQCANEARRLRKRGKQETRTTRVIIDEATCEGCGDCGAKSNCLSVQPVDTELGRKTKIDQTSCNTDYSCLLGDCPSFLTVQVAKTKPKKKAGAGEAPIVTEPVLPVDADMFLAGIGGTGIVTVNQLLATAALRSDLDTSGLSGLDQVGLSQKAGPVTSHLRAGGRGPANRVGHGTADVLLAFDALVAADPKNLQLCNSDFTIAVVSTSETPTGTQVADPSAPKTDVAGQVRKIREHAVKTFEIDALAASEALFGSTAPANLLLVGAAYQLGTLPFTAAAIEEAIELNGVAIAANVAAFRWGRAAVAAPEEFAAAVNPAATAVVPRTYDLGSSPLEGETRRLTEVRAQLLLDHSGKKAAADYVAVVERAWAAERAVMVATDYSQAVAKGTAHFAAYKDEYEVARLLTRPELLAEVQQQVPGATKVTYNLHPPALRSMGMDRKLKLGAWSRPMLKMTAARKVLRGTKLDPFGRAHVRVVERELLASHLALVEKLNASLSAETYATAVTAAAAPEMVRGFEDVKMRNVALYKELLVSLGLGD